MKSPVFNAMGGGMPQGGNMMQQFQRFMKEMKGKNPQEELNNLLQSGKINQQHLNAAQQQFEQVKGVLGGFFK